MQGRVGGETAYRASEEYVGVFVLGVHFGQPRIKDPAPHEAGAEGSLNKDCRSLGLLQNGGHRS